LTRRQSRTHAHHRIFAEAPTHTHTQASENSHTHLEKCEKTVWNILFIFRKIMENIYGLYLKFELCQVFHSIIEENNENV